MKKRKILTPAQIFRKSGLFFLLGIFSYFIINKFFLVFVFISFIIFLIYHRKLKEYINFPSKYFFLFLFFFFIGLTRPLYSFSFSLSLYPSYIINFSIKIKDLIGDKFNQFLKTQEKEILMSLLFGSKENLSNQLKSKLQKIGLSHIVAVSGFHLSFLNKGLSLFFSDFLSLNFRLIFPFLVLFNLFFVASAQFTPSVIRSAIMAFLSGFSAFSYRFYQPTNALILSIVLMLFFDPYLIFDISFELSFLATIGILYFAPLIENLLFGFLNPEEIFINENNFLLKTRNFFLKIIILNFSAFLTTFPLIIYRFSSFSVVSLIVNVLILPIIPYIMFLSILFLFFSFSFYLGLVFVFILKPFLIYFFLIINFFSRLSFASLQIPKSLNIVFLSFYPFLIYFYFFLKKKSEAKIKINF